MDYLQKFRVLINKLCFSLLRNTYETETKLVKELGS